MAGLADPNITPFAEAKDASDATTFPTKKVEAWQYLNLNYLKKFEEDESIASKSDSTLLPTYMKDAFFLSANELYGSIPEKITTELAPISNPYPNEDYFSNLNQSLNESVTTLNFKEKESTTANLVIQLKNNPVNWTRLHLNINNLSEVNLTLHFNHPENAESHSHFELSANLEAGSKLNLQLAHSSSNQSVILKNSNIILKRDSNLNIYDFGVNTKTVRHKFNIHLTEENAEASIHACQFLNEDNQGHHYIEMNHLVPHCRSNQFFKNLLLDKARSSFDGTVFVKKDANGTEAHQLNNNLILSDSARAYTKPRMKIKASDVACDHGATVGALEKDEVFYLVSRGLSEEQAKNILALGFLKEPMTECPNQDLFEWWFSSQTSSLTNIT